MLRDEGKPIQGLQGIRILDFTWAGAGPFATEQLCRMGADVVKVEAASRPDLLRVANIAYNWGPGGLESNSCFNDMNAGKRSISLDLKSEAGQKIALRLAEQADVVCDNMRPGKMEALGLGYEQLRNVNPRIISCSVSATGRVAMPEGKSQPDVPGYAPVFWAEGGGASVTGFPGEEPAYFRAPTDMNAAVYFAVGILAALVARERTGVGCHVDCSAVETVTCGVGDEVLAASLGLAAGGLRGNDRPPFAPNDTYPCAGLDSWIAISVRDSAEWESVCHVLKLSELAADSDLRQRRLRWERRVELYQVIADATKGWRANELEIALQAAGVAACTCATLAELLEDPALRGRGFWKSAHHPIIGEQKVGGLAFKTKPPMPEHGRGGPLLGEHTEQVLAEWLGIDRDLLMSLHAQGAFESWVPTGVEAVNIGL
jgi:benzylsuccinate CoA-transferase BbsF subunit